MAIQADVTRTGDTVTADAKVSLTEIRKPFYAYLGAGDFAVAKLRELPTTYAGEVKKSLDQVQAIPSQVKEIPAQVRTSLTTLSGRATELYSEFAVRGERLVTSIRKNPAAEAAVAEVKAAVTDAQTVVGDAAATGRDVKRAGRAGRKAVADTAAKVG